MPEALSAPEHDFLLAETGVNLKELQDMLAQLFAKQPQATSAIGQLLGKADSLPSQTTIDVIEGYRALISSLHGQINSLKNRIDQETEKNKSFRLTLALPQWLKELPAIPRISGGLPDYQQDLQETVSKYRQLRRSLKQHLDELTPSVTWGTVVKATCELETQHLQRHPDFNAFDTTELGQRKLLQMYVQQTKHSLLSSYKERVRDRLLASGVFAGDKPEKTINRLLFNDQGRVYVSPYSKRNNKPYPINKAALARLDILQWLAEDIQWLRRQVTPEAQSTNKAKQAQAMGLLGLESLQARLRLKALPETVSTRLFDRELLLSLRMRDDLRGLLSLAEVSSATAARLVNLLLTELRGLIAKVYRPEFILRTRFQLVGQHELIYTFKQEQGNQWYPPESMRSSDKPWVQWLNEQYPTDPVDPDSLRTCYKQHRSLWQRADNPLTSFFRQVPHQWYVLLGFVGSYDKLPVKQGVKVGKKTMTAPKDYSNAAIARMIGPSCRKEVLSRMLVDQRYKVGDYTLLIEQLFEQSLVIKGDEIEVTARAGSQPDALSMHVALPVTEAAPEPQPFPWGDSIIGIDLGEAGIGYAVFDVPTLTYQVSGSIPIKSIRNLIHSVSRYRNRKQPAQKYNQLHSSALAQLRDNVVGDVAHIIDSLCHKYSGIPVLESSVRNLAKGSKQLALVYDRILNLYTYSDVKAHKDDRAQHWYGSVNWEHPTLTVLAKNNKRKPLSIFPGVQVNPAFTSQYCSKCGRNPYDAIKKGYEGQQRLTTDENGKLGLGDLALPLYFDETQSKKRPVSLTLLTKENPEADKKTRELESKQLRRRKENPDFIFPLCNKTLNEKDARRYLRQQLRRRQHSSRSKDTTQSRYVCAFTDCDNVMHADENAAINIVIKWLRHYQVKPS